MFHQEKSTEIQCIFCYFYVEALLEYRLSGLKLSPKLCLQWRLFDSKIIALMRMPVTA